MIDRDAEPEPEPLPAEALALLRAYRDDEAMPAAARRRVWHEVSADATARVREPSTGGRLGSWVGGGLAAAAVIVLVARLLGGSSTAERVEDPALQAAPDRAVDHDADGDASPRRAGPDRGATDRSARDPEAEAANAEPERPPETSEAAAPVETHAPAPAPGGTRARAKRPGRERARPESSRATEPVAGGSIPSAEAPSAEPASDLAAERELIAAAWRALAKGSAVQARAHAQAHARRFPQGMLAPEREAVDAIAACRVASAPKPELAEAFERAHPRSALAGRVREACDPQAP